MLQVPKTSLLHALEKRPEVVLCSMENLADVEVKSVTELCARLSNGQCAYWLKGIVPQNISEMSLNHRHRIIVIVSPSPYHRHCITVIVSPSLYHRHRIIVIVSPSLYHRHRIIVIVSPSLYHRHCITVIVTTFLFQ